MAGVRGGVECAQSGGMVAAVAGARGWSDGCTRPAGGGTEAAQDGRIQLAAGISRLERRATGKDDSQDDAQPGMDGGGICANAALYAEKHRGSDCSRWK